MKRYLIIFTLFSLAVFAAGTANSSETEQQTSRYFNQIKADPIKLYAFLQAMPKGGELHTHLAGATYAENLLQYGKNDGWCVDATTLNLSKNNGCHPKRLLASVFEQPDFYNTLINRWSMRNFVADKKSNQDHFFSTFLLFFPIVSSHSGQILSEVVSRAGAQHESYLELMITPYELGLYDNNGDYAANLGSRISWDGNFAKFREKLLSSGLMNTINQIPKRLDAIESSMKSQLHCTATSPDPGCQVTVRYQYVTLRNMAPERVFAQLIAGFEAVKKDPRIVGINIVQAEDWPIATHDYNLHMSMINFLHSVYPQVHISLHAGELAAMDVPPETLHFHIRQAIEIGHAERIGHGADISYEDHAEQLLNDMAKDHIMVEINLTSNDILLNLRGKDHPFPQYLRYHVPVALSTDDEGVFRTDLTREYLRAAQTYNLNYATLKDLVRNVISYSFLPGASLWDNFSPPKIINACKYQLQTKTPSKTCQGFLATSEKARLQWQLEKQFKDFENQYRNIL